MDVAVAVGFSQAVVSPAIDIAVLIECRLKSKILLRGSCSFDIAQVPTLQFSFFYSGERREDEREGRRQREEKGANSL